MLDSIVKCMTNYTGSLWRLLSTDAYDAKRGRPDVRALIIQAESKQARFQLRAHTGSDFLNFILRLDRKHSHLSDRKVRHV